MSTLPRGIQHVSYKDSSYYRVRISRKDFKADKYFKSLDEAKEFLALSKAKKGKELIYSITEAERKARPSYGDFREPLKTAVFQPLIVRCGLKPPGVPIF